jgi:hypothetical protein
MDAVGAFIAWAEGNIDEIDVARAAYDARVQAEAAVTRT